jgi:hypothetical protein
MEPKTKKVIVIDETGRERGRKTRRRDRLPDHDPMMPPAAEELHPRTKNALLRQLAEEAERLGRATGTMWRMRSACGDEVDGDVLSAAKLARAFAILRRIENDAHRVGYAAKKYLPPIRAAFLTGLIERVEEERK